MATMLEHRKCKGVYCEPSERIDELDDDELVPLRQAARLLGVSAGELDQLLERGALRASEDDKGRPVILGRQLAKFADQLREVEIDENADEAAEAAGTVRVRLADLTAAISEGVATALRGVFGRDGMPPASGDGAPAPAGKR